MNVKKEILVILTGGTICSSPETGNDHKNQSNATEAKNHIIADFETSDSPRRDQIRFHPIHLKPDILSENMTVETWNRLLDLFRDTSVQTDYAGVIVLHGTDTLAYTSALLSIALAGFSIPICMVSAQLPLMKTVRETKNGVLTERKEKEERTNGYANFRAAAELIANGIAPNVYVVYRNVKDDQYTPDEFLVHYGAHLTQCPNYSNNFHSKDEMVISDPRDARLAGKPFETNDFCLHRFERLRPTVLLLTPHVGMQYSRLNLTGLEAVLHGTYHSDTVCVERKATDESYGDASILSLLDRCKEQKIPLYLAPCDAEAYAYASTGDALRQGAIPIAHTTLELAYVKTLVGCAMGLRGQALTDFLGRNVNHEFIYRPSFPSVEKL